MIVLSTLPTRFVVGIYPFAIFRFVEESGDIAVANQILSRLNLKRDTRFLGVASKTTSKNNFAGTHKK
jgi:hypothetical protein